MHWYDNEVQQLETKIKQLPPAENRIVFYGSSSIRLWKTLADDFPEQNTLNLGFGGSTLAACAWFFERLVVPANPKAVIFYAGDNDLGDSRLPEEVFLFFRALAEQMRQRLPGVPLAYLSIKISPARWRLAESIRLANKFIQEEIKHHPNWQAIDMTAPLLDGNGRPRRELFEADGLHLNPEGYLVWKQALRDQIRIF
ncbi:SGNH/GDSL hydrolase family protein [Spirosoma pomorum]